jgi:hypothetical protein
MSMFVNFSAPSGKCPQKITALAQMLRSTLATMSAFSVDLAAYVSLAVEPGVGPVGAQRLARLPGFLQQACTAAAIANRNTAVRVTQLVGCGCGDVPAHQVRMPWRCVGLMRKLADMSSPTGVVSRVLRIQLVRDEFSRPPLNSRSIGSEPSHTGLNCTSGHHDHLLAFHQPPPPLAPRSNDGCLARFLMHNNGLSAERWIPRYL